MDRGFEAWYRMLDELGAEPDLQLPSEEQAAREDFGLGVEVEQPALVAQTSIGTASLLDREDERENRAESELEETAASSAAAPRDAWTALLWIVAGSVGVLGIVNDLRVDASQHSLLLPTLAHLAFIGAALIRILGDRRRHLPAAGATGIVPRVWKQFLEGWTLLWAAWLALYAFLALASLIEDGPLAVAATAGADLFQVLSSYAFLYLFLILDRPSVPAAGSPERDRDFRSSLTSLHVVCGVTAVLSLASHLDLAPGLEPVAVWALSLLAAVSMMYFFMGLGYRELRIRRLMLAPLFLYVALQMLYPVIAGLQSAESQGITLPSPRLLLWVALVLKLHLYRLVTQWVREGRLLEYLEEVKFPRTLRDLSGR